MSPQIDLDPDIYAYLKSEAEPFMDTPNTVLRRLLHLNEPATATAPPAPQTRRTQATKAKQKGTRPRRHQQERVLHRARSCRRNVTRCPCCGRLSMRGAGSLSRCRRRRRSRHEGRPLACRLRESQLRCVRWQSRLQFVRLRLIQRGYLDKDTPRGIWGITDAGRAAFEEGQQS